MTSYQLCLYQLDAAIKESKSSIQRAVKNSLQETMFLNRLVSVVSVFFFLLLQYLFLPFFCDFILFGMKANRKCGLNHHIFSNQHMRTVFDRFLLRSIFAYLTFKLSRPKADFNYGLELIQGFLI